MSTARGMGAHLWVIVESDLLEKMHLSYDERDAMPEL